MKIQKSLIILFALTCLSSAHADFLDAAEAYENKDYEAAFKEFSELARLGNKRAQFNLGVMYLNGEGVEKNISLAYAWGKLSEHDAHPEFAQISERILKQVPTDSHHSLTIAAEEIQAEFGDQAIIHKLSPITYIPKSSDDSQQAVVTPIERGAPKYPKEALNERKQGWVTAVMDIHPDGSVRAVQVVESFPDSTFERSAIDALSQFKFKVSYPDQVEPYVIQAKQTMIYELALQASKGRVNKLYKERLNKLRTYASDDHPDAQYIYAVAARSHLVPDDQKITQDEANQWLLKAAQNGHVDAQYLLGKNILRGEGCRVEKQKAVDWIVYAAKQGHDKSAREVHRLLTKYNNLNNTNQTPETWLKQSAEAGNPESQLDYSEFLLSQSTPTKEDIKLAQTMLNDYKSERKAGVTWYQQMSRLASLNGNDKKAKKYQKKADKMAKKLGWDMTLAMQ